MFLTILCPVYVRNEMAIEKKTQFPCNQIGSNSSYLIAGKYS